MAASRREQSSLPKHLPQIGIWARLVSSTTGLATATTSQIAGLLATGTLRTNVGSVLHLEEAHAAHEMLEGKRARSRGKIVLRIAK